MLIGFYKNINKQFFGKKNKEKMNQGRITRKLSEETKRKISIAKMGHEVSEETRRKISLAQKGKKISEETRQKLRELNSGPRHPLWGKHRSEETKNKIRNRKINQYKSNPELINKIRNSVKELWQNEKYIEKHMGPKNPNWKGGLTKREETLAHRLRVELKNWAKKVLERDNYTCQRCGIRTKEKGVMEVHHIKAISKHPSLVLDISNGITLCKYCHYKTESYGRKFKKA